MAKAAKKRTRKADGARSIPIAFDAATLELIERVVEEEQARGSKLTRASLVRWAIREALAHGRPPLQY